MLSEDDHVGRKASEHDVISEGSSEVEDRGPGLPTTQKSLVNDGEEVKGYFLQSPTVVPPHILGGTLS